MCKKKLHLITAVCALSAPLPTAAQDQLRPGLSEPTVLGGPAVAAVEAPRVTLSAPPGDAPTAGKPRFVPEQTTTEPSPPAPAGTTAPTTITAGERLTDPITRAVTFEGHEDEVTYMSENGRYVIRGTLFDTWTGKIVQSLADVQQTMQGLDLARYGMTEADVAPFTWGKGRAVVSLFVDPHCPYCAQLFDQMRADPALADQYTFKIYTVAYLGDQSVKSVNALSCTPDKAQALDRLMAHDTRWMQTAQVPPCPTDPAVKRMMLAQALGITGVPFLIGPAGGMSKGNPPDLRGFLESN